MARFVAAAIAIIVILVASVFTAAYLYYPSVWPFNIAEQVGLDDTQSSAVTEGGQQVLTALQQSLKESIEQLEREGLPHPKVTFESTFDAPSSPEEREELVESQGSFETKLVATTTIEYESPEQAGKDRWDDIIITTTEDDAESSSRSAQADNDGGGGAVEGDINDDSRILLEGNLTQLLIDEHPEIYGEGEGRYQYGEEPRTFVIDEEITTTFVGTRETAIRSQGVSSPAAPIGNQNSYYVVMGFSYVPDRIDYSINPKWKMLWITIAEAKAGFIFDVGLGLRLPVKVDVTLPDTSYVSPSGSHEHEFLTSITPMDFDAQDYERLGIHPEDGHEFFARSELFLGFKAWFLGRPLIDYAIDSDVDMGRYCLEKLGLDCQDFVTPFGLDKNGVQREFPMVAWELSPDETGMRLNFGAIGLGFGFRVNPSLGSDKITADWSYTGGSISPESRGEITYVASHPVQYSFGPVAGDAGAAAAAATDVEMVSGNNSYNHTSLSIDNFKLHLNRNTLSLDGNLQLDFFGWRFFKSGYIEIVEIDFPESSIAQHEGTSGVAIPLVPALTVSDNETISGPDIIADGVANGTLTVSTDKDSYAAGEDVTISGYSELTGETLVIQVFNPNGAVYRFDLIPTSDLGNDGSYNYLLKVGGPLGVSGTYRVIMTEFDSTAETTFLLLN